MYSLNVPFLLQQAFSPAAAPAWASVVLALLAGGPGAEEIVQCGLTPQQKLWIWEEESLLAPMQEGQ